MNQLPMDEMGRVVGLIVRFSDSSMCADEGYEHKALGQKASMRVADTTTNSMRALSRARLRAVRASIQLSDTVWNEMQKFQICSWGKLGKARVLTRKKSILCACFTHTVGDCTAVCTGGHAWSCTYASWDGPRAVRLRTFTVCTGDHESYLLIFRVNDPCQLARRGPAGPYRRRSRPEKGYTVCVQYSIIMWQAAQDVQGAHASHCNESSH
jgi:hypothetical protein